MAKKYVRVDSAKECMDLVSTGALRWGTGKHPYIMDRTYKTEDQSDYPLYATPAQMPYDGWLYQIRTYGVFLAVDDDEE